MACCLGGAAEDLAVARLADRAMAKKAATPEVPDARLGRGVSAEFLAESNDGPVTVGAGDGELDALTLRPPPAVVAADVRVAPGLGLVIHAAHGDFLEPPGRGPSREESGRVPWRGRATA